MFEKNQNRIGWINSESNLEKTIHDAWIATSSAVKGI